jgi:uncharacterized membrane protein YhaH (DUF805 family)
MTDFFGYATRRQFWGIYLFTQIAGYLALPLAILLTFWNPLLMILAIIPAALFTLWTYVCWFAVVVRRLRTRGMSAFWVFPMQVLPLVLLVVVSILSRDDPMRMEAVELGLLVTTGLLHLWTLIELGILGDAPSNRPDVVRPAGRQGLPRSFA